MYKNLPNFDSLTKQPFCIQKKKMIKNFISNFNLPTGSMTNLTSSLTNINNNSNNNGCNDNNNKDITDNNNVQSDLNQHDNDDNSVFSDNYAAREKIVLNVGGIKVNLIYDTF